MFVNSENDGVFWKNSYQKESKVVIRLLSLR